MAKSMETGCGIYRLADEMEQTCRELAQLKERVQHVTLGDRAEGWNTEWLGLLELAYQLDVAQALAHSAAARRESRGAHQRLDPGLTERDDEKFLKHTLATYQRGGVPTISWSDVTITKSKPGVRAYGAAGEAKEKTHA